MPRPVENPKNPWSSTEIEWLGPPPDAKLEIFEEDARSALSKNDSPDVPFKWGLNPYRGCIHACAYCYARPTHQYLGFGAGTDFDRKIVVKRNIAEVLAKELARPSWAYETVCVSGNTDCYQPIEASYRLTRACLEVLADVGNPISVITKGVLVVRDLDVLVRASASAPVSVTISIPCGDPEVAKAMEPFAPKPERRFAALKALSDAGIDTCVSLSPLIPALNDADIPDVLERAHAAGARRAFMTLVRLPAEVDAVFESRLRAARPDRADRVLRAIASMRGGRRNDPRFESRMRGDGPQWHIARQLFESTCRRLGYETSSVDELSALEPEVTSRPKPPSSTRPSGKGQLKLF